MGTQYLVVLAKHQRQGSNFIEGRGVVGGGKGVVKAGYEGSNYVTTSHPSCIQRYRSIIDQAPAPSLNQWHNLM